MRGGSMATLVALAVARHVEAGWDVRKDGLQGDGGPRLVVYRSVQGHSCIQKAVELLGLGAAQLRTITVDLAYQMQVGALEAAIEADLAAGHCPAGGGGERGNGEYWGD
jgi:aromatic-L-amino-acid decarboxylase